LQHTYEQQKQLPEKMPQRKSWADEDSLSRSRSTQGAGSECMTVSQPLRTAARYDEEMDIVGETDSEDPYATVHGSGDEEGDSRAYALPEVQVSGTVATFDQCDVIAGISATAVTNKSLLIIPCAL
jgi:hypothetical protein